MITCKPNDFISVFTKLYIKISRMDPATLEHFLKNTYDNSIQIIEILLVLYFSLETKNEKNYLV